ncbi:MAG: hypothetical protein Q7K54_03535 [Candidatus Parcubacteria bacterium]|nr:hypothetical protein [Candidatus Parcubacteria bacterium]
MDIDYKLYDIQIIIAGAYDIKPIISVQKFNLTFSKFTTQEYHFLVKTSVDIFFLKKYQLSDLKRILCEISAINRFKKKLRIPKIILTKEKQNYVITNDSIFVLYEYINASNLKDTNEETQSFFEVLCDIESKLIKSNSDNKKFYDFKSHVSKFESEAIELLNILKTDKRIHAKRDIKYLKFLLKEVEEIKSEILNLKIVMNFIHGDLIMQNVVRDTNRTLWVLDWEKSMEYMTSVDILKSITFTLFDPTKENMNLDKDVFTLWSKYCFQKIPLSREEISNAFNLYYFHFITSISFLRKLYIEKQNLNEKMLGEDFLICKWFKNNKKEMQLNLNKILS